MREISFEEMQLVGGGHTHNIDDGTSPFDVVSDTCTWKGFGKSIVGGAVAGAAIGWWTGAGVAATSGIWGTGAGIAYATTCWW